MPAEFPPDFEFAPMSPDDVVPALQIINDFDADDCAYAAETYKHSFDGHFVLKENGVVVGVCGFKPIEGTDQSYAISWTYLHRELLGQGLGQGMIDSVLDVISEWGGRRVFVNTSDYYDPEDGDVYRDAREAYVRAGFAEELRHPNFYAAGESQVTYGLRLTDRSDATEAPPDYSAIRPVDIAEIDECDDAYFLAWEIDDSGRDASGVADILRSFVDQAASWGGRVVFAAVPSDLVEVRDLLQRERFHESGVLRDYFEDGLHEVHFRYDVQ